MGLSHTELTEVIRREGEAAAVAAGKDMTAAVPSCPGWAVETVVNHLGRLHRWAAEIVRSAGEAPAGFPSRPDEITPEWLEQGAAWLADTLREAAGDAPAWNFLGATPVAGFWSRRMAVETAIHRWDIQSAHGAPDPVERGVASAGVDEVLDLHLPRAFTAEQAPDIEGALHIHLTDIEGEWMVRVAGGRPEVTREHGKGDVAVRGPASDLLLVLWGRLELAQAPALEVFGDPGAAAAWLAVPARN